VWLQLPKHNGRAIINDTLVDYDNGVAEEKLKEKYAAAVKDGDYTRLVVYAGTGSGLITKKQTVNEILNEIEMQFEEEVKSLNERLRGL
jgi:nitronate monooxygenase